MKTTLNQALADLDQLHYRMCSCDDEGTFEVNNPWKEVEENFLYQLKFEYGDNPTPEQIHLALEASMQGLGAEARDHNIELDY